MTYPPIDNSRLWDASISFLCAHETHRQQGHPAISGLRGLVGSSMKCWRTWCQSNGRACVIAHGLDPKQWIGEYIQTFLTECDPFHMAKQALAKGLSISSESISPSRLTSPELGRLLDQAGWNDEGSARLCRRSLEAELKGESLSPDALFHWFSHDMEHESWVSIVSAIVDFLPTGLSPALLVVPFKESSDPTCDSSKLEKAAQQLAILISHVPFASVGLCAPDALFDHYLKSAPESNSKAVLRESLITIAGLSPKEISQTCTQQLGQPLSRWEKPIEQLAAHGASPELVNRFLDVVDKLDQLVQWEKPPCDEISDAPQIESDQAVAEPDAARSAAERFLYALFEETPDLTGLFELNAKPGFDFGGRPAEIDLACLAKSIAVEIDGYHHFTDASAYRRDRRKDVLLQKHGFFVLRFLAEDVVSEMESICQTIRTVVQLRK